MNPGGISAEHAVLDVARGAAYPLREGALGTYDPLLRLIGDARIVLIGEASHGTHEFYRERALITTRLIRELGFSFVAIEGDWPEAYAVNQFVRGGAGRAIDVLQRNFSVFPTWMWGNLDALRFVEWLRRYNDELPADRKKVGFYGLDLYSLYRSVGMVIDYLDKVDPETGRLARRRYACFEPFATKDQYAYSVGLGLAESCEHEVVSMLQDLCQRRHQLLDVSPDDSYFFSTMAAASARDGERYYRSMYRSDINSWNIRDCHMMDTLQQLLDHFGPSARAVVWEHNTHIGDFRATADAHGMVNVGQLARERFPGQSVAIGFGTYEGTVTAARAWGERPQRMTVPSARDDSYDAVFHHVDQPRFLLLLRSLRESDRAEELNRWRGQRAIGVVYHPEHETGNYVPTRLADRYDAYIHIDRTRAVAPLAIEPSWSLPVGEETYPTGY